MSDQRAKILNPKTNRMVLRSGKVGREIVAAEEAAKASKREAEKRAHEIQMLELTKRTEATTRKLRKLGAIPKKGDLKRDLPVRAAETGFTRKLGAYRERAFKIDPKLAPKTLAQFINTVFSKIKPNDKQLIITAEDPDNLERYRRTITDLTSPKAARKALEAILLAPVDTDGSDVIPSAGRFLPTVFSLGGLQPLKGAGVSLKGAPKKAGTMHPHFKLVDFIGKDNGKGDCLYTVLRRIAKASGVKVPKARNDTIRAKYGMPEGAVEATAANITALGREFGLYIRVITEMTVPPDAERNYDDCQSRLFNRNLCATVAEPLIIAESDNKKAKPCDVFLSENHYQYIARIIEPVRTCPITGDILADKPRSLAATRARVIQQGRTWYAKAEHKPTAKEKKIKKYVIIVYDYETIYTENSTLEPYALGYIKFAETRVNADFSGDTAKVAQIVRKPHQSRYHVSNPLLDELEALPLDTAAVLVSFNGARFDHFLLSEAANNRGTLSNVFATAGGGLRAVNIGGRHSTLDLAKLLPAMSLAKACKGFQTSPKKVEGFSHVEIQREYEAGRLYEWLDANTAKLSEYLAADVLSEASLFVKVSGELEEMTGQPVYGKGSAQTIGGHAWALMSKTCPLPKRVQSEDTDKWIRSAIVGGRTQVYGEAGKYEGDRLHMLDFASLYPTAMAAVDKCADIFTEREMWGYYPSGADNGEPEEVVEYVPNVVGLYDITIHSQPPNLPNVLPRRGEKLDWAYRGEFRTKATHTDIELIRGFGGSLTVHNGLIWRVSRQGLFRDFVQPLADRKDEQDQYDAEGNVEYNPALRMCLKLLMNSASGKCCQRNYDDMMTLAEGAPAQLAADRKFNQDHPRTVIPIGGNAVLITGKKPAKSVYGRNAKPSILAVLIYSYSRALVWRTLCQHNVMYSDTDSGLFMRTDYEAIREAFPALNPEGRKKTLGDLEEELPEHDRCVAYLMAPKDYAIFPYKDGERVKGAKIRIKGVNMRSDRLVNLGVDIAEIMDGAAMRDKTELYYGDSTEISKPLSDLTTTQELYQRRIDGDPVKVLSSQIVRNMREVGGAIPLTLTQRYLIKEIGKKAKDPEESAEESDEE